MNCTACGLPILYSGGENKQDFHCSNKQCCAAKEINYYTHVSVKNNWWFAEQYTLPFKIENEWYYVSGPNSFEFSYISYLKFSYHKTIFYKLNTQVRSFWRPSDSNEFEYVFNRSEALVPDKLFEIDYMALPVNKDFNNEFDKLIKKFKAMLVLG